MTKTKENDQPLALSRKSSLPIRSPASGIYEELGQNQAQYANCTDYTAFPNLRRWFLEMERLPHHDVAHAIWTLIGDARRVEGGMRTIARANKEAARKFVELATSPKVQAEGIVKKFNWYPGIDAGHLKGHLAQADWDKLFVDVTPEDLASKGKSFPIKQYSDEIVEAYETQVSK